MDFSSFFEGERPVVTMDFDHNLKFETGEPNLETIKQYKELQKEYDMYIVTTRQDLSHYRDEIQDFLKENGLIAKDIIFTSGEWKVDTIMKLKSIMHFDDDEDELKKIDQKHGNIKTVLTFNQKKWDEYFAAMTEEEEEEVVYAPKKKVFLGGTANETNWREGFIEMLDSSNVDHFDPVVPDWNEEAYQRELKERETSDFVLYTITPKMKGVYSIAEVVDDSNKRPEKTLFVVLEDDGDAKFDEAQLKSLDAVKRMIVLNGARSFVNLEECASFINTI